jgi:phosphoglucomutase
MNAITPETQKKIDSWLTTDFDKETHEKIKELQNDDPEALQEAFYKNLEFGTGGMRGIMGVGTNRINKYTLGKNTQGLSNYLKQTFDDEQIKVAIAYDCRNNSKELAQIVANVFSANDIVAYIFSDLRPTPELSFAVKQLNCHCGIVLTASHNPPEYNGYKVYWQDGGQLVPPQDGEIIELIENLKYSEINFESKSELIQTIDEKIDDAFIKASLKNGSFSDLKEYRDKTTVVFTPLHGTSVTLIPEVLDRAGYKKVHMVKEQMEPDGNFPTVKSPNPEEPEALKMATDLAEEKNADIVIGTDPDGDRLGIAVRDNNGEMLLLNGNQTMLVMTDFLLKKYMDHNTPNGNEFIASTVVSTPMMEVLAKSYGVECKLGLTGFKWIAKMIKDFPEEHFIGGGEESFGYMVGDFVRDKDAVTATLLACEIVTWAKANDTSFYKMLIDLYVAHGFYKEKLVALVKKGISGAEEINHIMKELRENPMKSINGEKVVQIDDYKTSKSVHIATGNTDEIDIPKSNVLIYHTEAGSRIAARPSGTEPKIKFYISVNHTLDNVSDFEKINQKLDDKINGIIRELGV